MYEPNQWAIIILLEQVDEFCNQNPNEVGNLSKNSALVLQILSRLMELYSVGEGEKLN